MFYLFIIIIEAVE